MAAANAANAANQPTARDAGAFEQKKPSPSPGIRTGDEDVADLAAHVNLTQFGVRELSPALTLNR